MLWELARAGVSIASPHTAFDNTTGGINEGLARRLGLVDVTGLRPGPASPQFKVVVFTPEADRDAVLAAVFEQGAGRIGAYEECSFAIPGEGTFFGTESANPTVGQAGRRESVRELRLEFVCPGTRLAHVLAAIRASHSYEEPAMDVYPLQAQAQGPGIGRIGRLPNPISLRELSARVGAALKTAGVQVVGQPDRRVERVAIACGAGDDFLRDAAGAGADVLVTGEARFHRALEASSIGLGLIVAGHHATERPGVEDLAGLLATAFPNLRVWPSRVEADPLWVAHER
jgi:putative NIF3 family GTP cyclohydrolase 1 type 2